MNGLRRATALIGLLSGARKTSFLPSFRPLCMFILLILAAELPAPAGAQTIDRIQSAGKIVLGYEADTRPFSFADASGTPEGYGIALCGKIVDEIMAQLDRHDLSVEWKPVAREARFAAISSGRIDLLCTPESIALSARSNISFSLPVFPGGVGAVTPAKVGAMLSQVLADQSIKPHPIWRGSPARTFLQQKTFAIVPGTTAEVWAKGRLQTLNLSSTLLPVQSYDDGVQSVLDGRAAAFFGSLPILMDAVANSKAPAKLAVLQWHFTREPMGFALARSDEDFRLLVDRALSHAYQDEGFPDLFTTWFGTPDDSLVSFYKQTALPD